MDPCASVRSRRSRAPTRSPRPKSSRRSMPTTCGRPKKPLTVLVLRTYLLPETIELPYRDEYGGCTSWIELASDVSVEGARAALSDEDFDRLVAPALGVLGRLELAHVGT